MKIEQLYTGCLAEAAYYIESEGEAVVIDPLRETGPYLEMAQKDNAKIKYVLETHFHADFVSGHIDLARKSGATIVYGPTAAPDFDAHIAEDGEILGIGKVKIKVIHTPGHTMESSSYLLYDENGKEHALFSGDTIFIGDVGRPDLAVSSNRTKEDLAGMLYDSIWNKLMLLPDEVLLYPNHGAGSLCGKNMSSETMSTLGEQRRTNYALQEMSKTQFVNVVTEGIPVAPQYFPKNAVINRKGYTPIEEVMSNGNKALDIEEFQELVGRGHIVLDVREEMDYASAHVPGSINVGLEGSFAVWVGTLIEDLSAPLLIIAPQGREEETVLRLARVGFDKTQGYLENGFSTWRANGNPVKSIGTISANKFDRAVLGEASVVDVRNEMEYEAEHVQGAINICLRSISEGALDLDPGQEIYLYCETGYRSMTAASILQAKGFRKLIVIEGGMEALRRTDIPMVAVQHA